MPSTTNTQVIYKRIPNGLPDPDKDFEIITTTIILEDTIVPPNHMLIRTLYMSLDPYMRVRLRDRDPLFCKSLFPASTPNTCFTGGVVGEVIKSSDPKYKGGDVVVCFSTWEEYALVQTRDATLGEIVIIPNARESPFPLSYYLGVLGMPGITAYMGFHEVCKPFIPGQTLYVSAASGAVGQIVGQYSKTLGYRVVGSAGSDAKVNFLLNDLGFDAAFNYKTNPDFLAILNEKCPDGIDVYFENVGGKMFDAVLEVANNHCCIPMCGMISQYNKTDHQDPIFNMWHVIPKMIKIHGFVVMDGMEKYGQEAVETFGKLILDGKMKFKESITEGIATAPHAFVDLLQGKSLGKSVVKVADL